MNTCLNINNMDGIFGCYFLAEIVGWWLKYLRINYTLVNPTKEEVFDRRREAGDIWDATISVCSSIQAYFLPQILHAEKSVRPATLHSTTTGEDHNRHGTRIHITLIFL